jgi:hypothetical protein
VLEAEIERMVLSCQPRPEMFVDLFSRENYGMVYIPVIPATVGSLK